MIRKYIIVLFLIYSLHSFAQTDEIMVIHNVATTALMNAINNPEKGSLVYNNTEKRVFVFDGTVWVVHKVEHTPYISNDNAQLVKANQTKTVTFTGYDFTPTTVLTIPGFPGTINTITIVSSTVIDVNLTANNTEGLYDIVVTNNSATNTSWVGNDANLLQIWAEKGINQEQANTSCKAILDDGFSTGDGTYWINPDGGSTDNAFEVYCDMTNGGWIKLEYAADLTHINHFGNVPDGTRWLPTNFIFNLTDTQINDIRSVSTEAKQTYVGSCDGVIHYRYQAANYNYAFGFRYHTGFETAAQSQTYPNTNITIPEDNCVSNGNGSTRTLFDIVDIRLPVINVKSRDNGAASEYFGSPLTINPVWFR